MKRFFCIFIILFTETYCQATHPPGTIICNVKQTGTCMGGCDLSSPKKCSKTSDCYDGNTYFDRYPYFQMNFYCDLPNGVCCQHSKANRFDACGNEQYILVYGQKRCASGVFNCTNDFGQHGICLTDRLNSYCCPDLNTTQVLPDFRSNTECDVSKALPPLSVRTYCRDGYVYSAALETLNKNAGKTLTNCQTNSNCTSGEYCMRNTASSPLQCYLVHSQKSDESSAAGTIATVVLIILAVIICAGAIAAIIFLKLAKYLIGVAVGVFILIVAIILIIYFSV